MPAQEKKKPAARVFCAYRLPAAIREIVKAEAKKLGLSEADVLVRAMEQFAKPMIKVDVSHVGVANRAIEFSKRVPRQTRAPLLKRGGTIL